MTPNKLKIKVNDKTQTVTVDGQTMPLHEINGHHYFLYAVPNSALTRDEEAQPRDYNEKRGQEIAKSIKQKLIMQPIMCRWSEDHEAVLITEGQHRWRAMSDILEKEGVAGADRTPAIVYIDLERRLALQCGIEANAEDRARALSGREMARKAASILEVTRQDIAQKESKEPEDISEKQIFAYLGKRKKSDEKKYLLGALIEALEEDEEAHITQYMSDRSSKLKPITVKNFEFFLSRLTYLQALDSGEENLREDQYLTVRRLTNILVEAVLNDKWDPEDPERLEHKHTANIVRRHPFEALGYFFAKILDRNGGHEMTVGAAWAKHTDIKWDKVEAKVNDLLASGVWDEIQTYTCRNIDELKSIINGVVEI